MTLPVVVDSRGGGNIVIYVWKNARRVTGGRVDGRRVTRKSGTKIDKGVVGGMEV